MSEILKRLFELQDLAYRDFHSALMPSVDKSRVIGVRVPLVRRLAKEIMNTELALEFVKNLPHKYYEENNLHAFLIEGIKDFDECITALEAFLPYVDNWSTCDSLSPKVLKTNKKRLLDKCDEWLCSDDVYVVRFAIGVLMKYFLDEDFDEKYLIKIAGIKREEYYIKMMVAWYFATALAKQYESALKILEGKLLDSWTHNKAIQKAVESRRISSARKEYLKKLKVI